MKIYEDQPIKLTGAQHFVHRIAPDAPNRAADDFYKTPPQGMQRLLDVESFNDGLVWDPACGDGVLGEVMNQNGCTVVSSDLIDRGYGATGIDFLTTRGRPKGVKHIVTNPPFKLAIPFAKRALEIAPGKVALLFRVLMLEGSRRRPFYESTPLARIWVFSSRINVCRNGEMSPNWKADGSGGMIAFSWFIWEKGYTGKPQIGWI
jgi:hypothetical protein